MPRVKTSVSRRGARWLRTGVLSLSAAIGIAYAALLSHGPFTQSALVETLQETLGGNVEIKDFHRTYFPHLGCEALDLNFHSRRDAGEQLQITARKLTVRESLADLMRNRVSEV